MTPTKEHLLSLLDAFVHQRSGMDPRNYGDFASYRSEQRRVTQDLNDYRAIRAVVTFADGITAEHLLEASKHAFSGRLSFTEVTLKDGTAGVRIDYCPGQYFPTEYRRAACAVLASALWKHARRPENMPQQHETHQDFEVGHAMRDEVGDLVVVSAGDWLRDKFRKEFGPRLQRRYFD